MSEKPKVLLQFDSDQHPSVFDSIVAIDSGVDHLLPFGSVEPLDIRELVHGAMFTRGGKSLKNTAIFIGGSNVQLAENILRSVTSFFFGSVRVSVMMDANGANTTAAAAVLCLQRHLDVAGKSIAVLAATGSVGNRVSRILAMQDATVRVASRNVDRASALCDHLQNDDGTLSLLPYQTDNPDEFKAILDGADAVIAAGAAGIQLIRSEQWADNQSIKVAIDLNAVPPTGIEGIDVLARGESKSGTHLFGAIGVGELKMKIHRHCIQSLFASNDQVLDIDEIFAIGQKLESGLIA